MFHYDDGLKLTSIDLALDMRRGQARGFISHAHADHMARHRMAYCTPVTAALYQLRLGARPVRLLPFGETLEWNGVRLATHPAGHVFGSAMLWAEEAGVSFLYTGDFKLGSSATAEPCQLPRADILVMESTFGDPRYKLPAREEVVADFVALVNHQLTLGRTPVVCVYALGKAQEATKLLTAAGVRVLQHPDVFAISEVYRAHGADLGDYALYPGHVVPGCAVVAPPRGQRGSSLAGLTRPVTIALTGWAVHRGARQWLKVDHALPLSDHADYDELIEAARRVGAREIHCTHGPATFVDRLCELGFHAQVLGRPRQPRLF